MSSIDLQVFKKVFDLLQPSRPRRRHAHRSLCRLRICPRRRLRNRAGAPREVMARRARRDLKHFLMLSLRKRSRATGFQKLTMLWRRFQLLRGLRFPHMSIHQ
jgi:hypothetical protein